MGRRAPWRSRPDRRSRDGCSRGSHYAAPNAPVAQLDRVPGYEPGGRRFESFRARHLFNRSVVSFLHFPIVFRRRSPADGLSTWQRVDQSLDRSWIAGADTGHAGPAPRAAATDWIDRSRRMFAAVTPFGLPASVAPQRKSGHKRCLRQSPLGVTRARQPDSDFTAGSRCRNLVRQCGRDATPHSHPSQQSDRTRDRLTRMRRSSLRARGRGSFSSRAHRSSRKRFSSPKLYRFATLCYDMRA